MKNLRSILAVGALLVSSALYAEVTTVYSIDYTAEGATPLEGSELLTCDEENGLTYTFTGSGWNQFKIANSASLNDSQFYTVKIYAKASENKTIHLYYGNWTYDLGKDINFTTDWQEITFITQALSNGNYFMNLQPGGWNGTINIKSVTVTTGDEPYEPDLLCLVASNVEKKSNTWDNQVNYTFKPTPLETGTYTLAFDINGTNDGKMSIWGGYAYKLTAEDEDYQKDQWGNYSPTIGWYGPSVDIVKDTWKHYEFTWTFDSEKTTKIGGVETTVLADFCSFNLSFGNSFEGDLYIDNVVLRKAGDDTDIIPNGDFKRMSMGNWSKGYMHSFDLAIANGPEHPAVTRTADANSIWFGEKKMGWGDGVTIGKEIFADVRPGDVLKFNYDGGRYVQIIIGGWSGSNRNPWEPYFTYTEEDGKGVAVLELKEEYYDIIIEENVKVDGVETKVPTNYNFFELLKNGGMAIQGGGNTIYEVIYIPVNKIAYVDAENSISFDTNYVGKDGDVWIANNIKLVDAVKYTADKDLTAKNLKYTREFAHTEWQALYVPFDLAYAEWEGKAEIAELSEVVNKDGAISLVWNTVTSGSLTPNTPYLIKPAAAGTVEFTATNKTLVAAAEESTIKTPVRLTGIYTVKDMTDGSYGLSNGTFYKTEDATKVLNPFRFYLTIATSSAPLKISNVVDDQNVSGIEGIIIEDTLNNTYYDLQGRKIENPTSGLYIKNNQKVIIR